MRNKPAVVRGAKWLTALAFALAWLGTGPAQAAGAASDRFPTLPWEKIGIPCDAVLLVAVPAGRPRPGDTGYAALIARHAARVPGGGDASLALTAATVVPGKQPVLELRVKADQPLRAPDAFVEGPEGVTLGAPRLVQGEAPGPAPLRLPVFGHHLAFTHMLPRPSPLTL